MRQLPRHRPSPPRMPVKHPNAFYIGDTLLADDSHWVTVRAFVKPAGGRQLVRVEYPDGSCRNRAFESLSADPTPPLSDIRSTGHSEQSCAAARVARARL